MYIYMCVCVQSPNSHVGFWLKMGPCAVQAGNQTMKDMKIHREISATLFSDTLCQTQITGSNEKELAAPTSCMRSSSISQH